jgi:hypothetical protein
MKTVTINSKTKNPFSGFKQVVRRRNPNPVWNPKVKKSSQDCSTHSVTMSAWIASFVGAVKSLWTSKEEPLATTEDGQRSSQHASASSLRPEIKRKRTADVEIMAGFQATAPSSRKKQKPVTFISTATPPSMRKKMKTATAAQERSPDLPASSRGTLTKQRAARVRLEPLPREIAAAK